MPVICRAVISAQLDKAVEEVSVGAAGLHPESQSGREGSATALWQSADEATSGSASTGTLFHSPPPPIVTSCH